MPTFVLKRLGMLPIVLFGVVLISFLIVHLTPGDPARLMAGENATEAAVEAVRQRLGLDDPLWAQFWRYLSDVVTGNLGGSLMTSQPVSSEIAQALPQTAKLVGLALLVSTVGGIAFGGLAAVRAGGPFDKAVMVAALGGMSVPGFVIGLVFVVVFAVKLGWFPAFGSGAGFFQGGWRNVVLPAVALGIGPMGSVARMTRSTVLEVLPEDYVRTARARGLREFAVVVKHVGKNAAIPILTLIGLDIGYYLGGSVAIEVAFGWPGMGRLAVQAILNKDFPTVQGTVMVFALGYVLINLVVDLMYAWLDPRVRLS
jgi:glutathione transport system permease protein